MRTAGIWVVVVAIGGVLLGALLGSAATPAMKDPPAPWWQQDADPSDDAAAYAFTQPEPPLNDAAGGYRPDLNYAAEVWALPIPDYELAPLFDDRPERFADDIAARTDEAIAAEVAADRAEAAATEAAAAAAARPAPPEVRKSELAKAGLY